VSENVQIFTLKQVVSSIRKTIEERYQKTYWVKVEMHKLNLFPSGHCFPELLQKEDGKIVAQISGSIWKHNFERINKNFIEVVKEPIKDDSTLLMNVKVAFHEIYGMSLQILDIDPNYTLGELHRERTETLQRLKRENLLNKNQNIPFPLLPKRIAVISADSSKGLSDFMKVIDGNSWGYSFFTMLFPAYLQGDLAATSIIKQLSQIKKVQHHFDIVVIVRGGGGEVGLSCYNDYELCKAIASFPIPVLTGIGHSTNMTVAEMISFRNAITPTELGEFLLQAFHNFSVPIKDAVKTLSTYTSKTLKENEYALNMTSTRFKNQVDRLLKNEAYEIDGIRKLMGTSLRHYFDFQKERMRRNEQQISRDGLLTLQSEKNELNAFHHKLGHISQRFIELQRSQLSDMSHQVRLLDPKNILERGYSISTINGRPIKKSVKKGDVVITKTAEITFESIVSKENSSNG
jgi:exodeoxyribonuclease VII large subunit